MTELSHEQLAIASKRLAIGLQSIETALSSTSLEVLAKALGKSDTTVVCRIRSEESKATISEIVRLIYASGLKVVNADRVCVDGKTYEAMATIAAKAMSNPNITRQLTWDDTQ
jgi:hypothetical protein